MTNCYGESDAACCLLSAVLPSTVHAPRLLLTYVCEGHIGDSLVCEWETTSAPHSHVHVCVCVCVCVRVSLADAMLIDAFLRASGRPGARYELSTNSSGIEETWVLAA